MADRIHIVVDEAEKARFQRRAEREGKSLSAWLRDAARDKLEEADEADAIDTLEELDAFFAEADARERGREPDWEQHRRVIGRSQRSGGEAA